MGSFDEKSWSAEARSYERVSRLHRRFIVGYVVPVLTFVILAIVGRDRKELDYVLTFLFLLLIPIVCICVLGYFVTWIDLWSFHCPRCGKRFAIAWWSRWPTDRCKHCGFDLSSTAKTTTKPPSVTDPWE
jgi:hypothetical protein